MRVIYPNVIFEGNKKSSRLFTCLLSILGWMPGCVRELPTYHSMSTYHAMCLQDLSLTYSGVPYWLLFILFKKIIIIVSKWGCTPPAHCLLTVLFIARSWIHFPSLCFSHFSLISFIFSHFSLWGAFGVAITLWHRRAE